MVDPENNSAQWIRELVAGDEDVVHEFWVAYAPALERIAKRRMNPALQQRLGPEDILQSVCRTFIRRGRKGEYQLDSSEELWRLLCAITLTKVRQHARFHLRKRRGMNREVSLEGERADGSAGLPDRAVARGPAPAEAAEFADQVDHLFAGLDEEEQQLVQLRLEGLDGPTIAGKMGCSERTVRRLLERVRLRWEQEIQESIS
jgi:RNA polymerase sigma-70 factor, ECF subfamily